jgi:hypothetical protein
MALARLFAPDLDAAFKKIVPGGLPARAIPPGNNEVLPQEGTKKKT